MKRIATLLTFVAVPGLLASAVPAAAATPATATLSAKKKTVTWGGSFTASQPIAGVVASGCVLGESDPMCDHFKLKINLGEGAKIRVSIPAQQATDIDFAVFAPDGSEVASSGNLPGEAEMAEFIHRARFRNRQYEVQVVPYLVAPGTTYKGTVKAITLGKK
jgi:hypothetical protein